MNAFTRTFEELLRIIRDYGLPTAAFGAGIYGFLVVLNVEVAIEIKMLLAGVLSLAGLATQTWIFAREHPKIHGDEYTRLVEKMIEQNDFYIRCVNETQRQMLRLLGSKTEVAQAQLKVDGQADQPG